MHGLSLWKANSSELNLFFPLFWLDVGVNAVQRSFLYWDDSSKASLLLAIKLTNKRPCLHYSKPLLKQQSQTHIIPLYWCCKSTRTKRRGTITRAGMIIHIKHEPKETMNQTLMWKSTFPPPVIYCVYLLALHSLFIFLLSHFWHARLNAKINPEGRHFVFSGWAPYMTVRWRPICTGHIRRFELWTMTGPFWLQKVIKLSRKCNY